jgi:Ni/Co efflux regulator RcnB
MSTAVYVRSWKKITTLSAKLFQNELYFQDYSRYNLNGGSHDVTIAKR